MTRLLVCLLLLPQMASAATFVLIWDYPWALGVDAFDITVIEEQAGTEVTYRVPLSTPDACGEGHPATSFCAALPTCPAEGVRVFLVQARRGAALTTRAEAERHRLHCRFVPFTPCVCHPEASAAVAPVTIPDPAIRPPRDGLSSTGPALSALPTLPALPSFQPPATAAPT